MYNTRYNAENGRQYGRCTRSVDRDTMSHRVPRNIHRYQDLGDYEMGRGGSSLSQTSRGTTPRHWRRNPLRRKATHPADNSQRTLYLFRQYCTWLHQIHFPRAKSVHHIPVLLSPIAPRLASRFRYLFPRLNHSQ